MEQHLVKIKALLYEADKLLSKVAVESQFQYSEPKQESLTLKLPTDLYVKLKDKAKKDNKPMAVIIRNMLKEHL